MFFEYDMLPYYTLLCTSKTGDYFPPPLSVWHVSIVIAFSLIFICLANFGVYLEILKIKWFNVVDE